MANETIIENTIGEPLSNLVVKGGDNDARKLTSALQLKALPICNIAPCVMQLGAGIKDFILHPSWDIYAGLAAQHGVTINGRGELKVHFYPESPITETFSNNYGDSFIASYMKSLGGEGLTDLNQMAGGKGSFGGSVENILGQLGPVGDFLSSAVNTAKRNAPFQGTALGKGIYTAVDQALGGSRFDFPFVWKSSGFNANYSINVKLFNPTPGDAETTAKYIMGPLCALLCLGLPIGDGAAYSWPLVHMVRVPGFFASRAMGLQNITVTKGGEQNLRSMDTGFVAMVDVRLDFMNLFDPMVAGDVAGLSYRTSLTEYLENLISTQSQLESPPTTTHTPAAAQSLPTDTSRLNLGSVAGNVPEPPTLTGGWGLGGFNNPGSGNIFNR